MRIGFFQAASETGAPDRNLDRLERAAEAAAGQDVAILIAPEMFLSGYNIGAVEVARHAEPADGPSAARASAIARRTGVALLYGYPERGSDGAVYNAARLIGRDGTPLLNHRKTHLFGDLDRSQFAPGEDHFALAEIDGLRIGVLICYEVEFPELVRRHALAGADAVLVPTALMKPFDIVTRCVVPTRAFENQIFVAYANRTGVEGELDYCGLSCLAGPDGAVLARGGEGEELLVAELDPAALAAARAVSGFLADRRPALYRALSGEPERL
ncbi:carbon-nitrogen hydrolase family protein [Azospirillum sp. SYSU D00513]|uniref:carbon-nitrogen hydrolase family protein n=1 Tax=Azospirillum sp. SYSU D00513 TaxID=2812561 RepID=UPI001A96C7E2|nr:carbon-nitrogen hydrolase family protein [Azospirillum sp. SYSU D00513]